MNRLTRALGFDSARRFVWTPVPALGIDVYSREWSAGLTNAWIGGPGRPAPIVLVPGLGVSSRYFVPLARRLAALGHDVLAPDLPGFGHTARSRGSRWPAGPSPREQADHLRAWLDARHLGRVVLVGHSVGSQTASDFAARFPERVTRLVLMGPTHERGLRSVRRQLPRLALGGLFELPALIALLPIEYGISAGPARVFQQALHALPDAMEQRLPGIEVPTLVIRGEWDPLATQRWSETVADAAPLAGLVVIRRAGHAVQYTAPDVTADVIERFLDGRLDVAAPQASGTRVAPMARRRKLGPLATPAQPIPAGMHRALDVATAVAAIALPRFVDCGPRTRRLLAATALLGTANAFLTDFGKGERVPRGRLPLVTHLNLDLAAGANLIAAAATRLRHEPKAGRRAMAILGAIQAAAAFLTHVPTGPARWRTAAGPRQPERPSQRRAGHRPAGRGEGNESAGISEGRVAARV